MVHFGPHGDDLAYIRMLQEKLAVLQVPRYGSVQSYTKAVAWFVDSWKTNSIEKAVSAVSGSQDHIANYFYEVAETRHKRDAELHILTKIEQYLTQNAEGTLYIVQNKGPCRSCKNVIKRVFQSYYTNIRVVIRYSVETHRAHDGMLYGYQGVPRCAGGYIAVYEAYNVQRWPSP